jgi:hypothetical protein
MVIVAGLLDERWLVEVEVEVEAIVGSGGPSRLLQVGDNSFPGRAFGPAAGVIQT